MRARSLRRATGAELPAGGLRGSIACRTRPCPRLGVSPPLPAPSPVLVAVLFGLGAALLVLGVVDVNLLALAIGAVLVIVAVRLRSQGQQRAGPEAADTDDADDGASDASEAERDEASQTGMERRGETDDGGDDRAASPGDEGGLVMEAADEVTAADEDAETLYGSGYQLRDTTSGDVIDSRKLTLRRDGAQVIALEIASDQADELQADELAPGQPVVLVPHRGSGGRVDGIRVFDEVIDHLAGWLPDESAEELAGELRRGTLPARSLYEWRDSTGQRRGLTVVVHRPGVIPDG